MRRVVPLLVLAVLALAPAGAQAAQSSNVESLASLPELKTAISINFIGDSMFVSTASGVYAYDVSQPSRPRFLSALTIPVWENEDVDLDPVRKRLFVSRDPRGFTTPAVPGNVFPYGAVHIVDVSNPSNLRQLNMFLVEAGHTTTCVNRCDFVWTAGPGTSYTTQPSDWEGRPIFATDVRDPMNPKACPHPIDTGRDDGVTAYVHDVQVDAAGVAWVSGQGGVRGYWTEGVHRDPVSGKTVTATACDPVPYAGSGTPTSATSSRFMHNAWRDYTAPAPVTRRDHSRRRTVRERSRRVRDLRPRRRAARKRGAVGRRVVSTPASPRRAASYGPVAQVEQPLTRNDVLLGTEENIVTDCATSGRFVTYDLRGTYDGEGFKDTARTKHRMRVLDTWTPEKAEGASGCDSAHYFTSRGDGITANAFYTQGVRFLDTSDPRDIRQVGYWAPPESETWAAYWHKGVVYVADVVRGVEVLRFSGRAGRSATVRAPTTGGSAAKRHGLRFSRDTFGGLCPLNVVKA